MGTRSITAIMDNDGNKIVEIYQQFDGYPEGVGKEIVEFLKSGELVNGITSKDTRQFNGMECLTAQFIAEFKNGAGGLYVYAPTRNFKNKKKYNQLYGAEYYYEITSDMKVVCWDCANNNIVEIPKE